ncbi:hypothetical protein DFH09DRAFT_1083621 [Mycena vulgaris]|nr:hypothetical protein DFH09DRAFT_1083621 [Mycena vulgaris]
MSEFQSARSLFLHSSSPPAPSFPPSSRPLPASGPPSVIPGTPLPASTTFSVLSANVVTRYDIYFGFLTRDVLVDLSDLRDIHPCPLHLLSLRRSGRSNGSSPIRAPDRSSLPSFSSSFNAHRSLSRATTSATGVQQALDRSGYWAAGAGR